LPKEIFHALGRRKSSVARVFLTEGTGKIWVNGEDLHKYLKRDSLTMLVRQLQDESQKKVLKAGGFLTRDPREKERKKYGQPGRRKKFQFSKR